MVGEKFLPTSGMELYGQYGKYRLEQNIGHGGNGSVFTVEIIERKESLPKEIKYVIKILSFESNDNKEVEKRTTRFEKEIRDVHFIQKKITGIIPIYDSSYLCEDKQKCLWYLMPFAEAYHPKKYSTLEKLEQMLQLGKCVNQLHALDYAHRDIKPKNLLIYNGKLCLSDFGLIWNRNNCDEHITEVNDRLGPMSIRPPELQSVKNIDEIDYRKSDVYLFGKTTWMILCCNNSGFSGEYNRTNSNIYLDVDNLQVETAEPLHLMMEMATKDNYWERTNITECINYLEDQIKVIKRTIPQDIVTKWIFEEKVKRIGNSIPVDKKVYSNPDSILRILTDMVNITSLTFFEAGKTYIALSLKRVQYVKDCLFELEVQIPNIMRKKTIAVPIKDICLEGNKSFVIHMNTYPVDVTLGKKPVSVEEAINNDDNYVYLNHEYSIIMSLLKTTI